jgi:ribose 5-phosphate isomerase B
VAKGDAALGLCVCGSGIGIAMAANKIHGVRAAVVHDVTSARLARRHNDANVICLGQRLIGREIACEALDEFLSTEFEGGRHVARVDKIARLEKEEDQP